MKNMPEKKNHISICVCTFKRPRLLERLLANLETLITDNLFTYSIIVVDNAHDQSGHSVTTAFQNKSLTKIDYYHEPKRSISYARNKAVKNAKGNLIAFIDDDEFPDNQWLLNLYKVLNSYKVDGVLGPVKPHFETKPPEWIIKSKVCERDTFETGKFIENSKYTRTGNVLIKHNIFKKLAVPFDPHFGLSGGGDADFFKKRIEEGFTFIWCNEAIVYETVTVDRYKRIYYIKRAFTRGMGETKHVPFLNILTVKSLVAVCLYMLILPILLLVSHHLFMRYLIKNCDHLGKLLAYIGITVIKERPY